MSSHAAASATGRPRPRRRSNHCRPPRHSYPRPDLFLPQLDRVVIALDRATRGLLPRPAVPPEQAPRALHRVRDVEEATDQLLDPRQGPPLVSPAVCKRSTIQLPLQPGDLLIAEPRTAGRPLRGDTGRPTLTPLPPPPFHRSFRHPQSTSDDLVPVPGFEPSHSIQPYPLPGCPLSVVQAAALRVPHSDSSTGQRAQRSAERPDITQSSSVAGSADAAPRLRRPRRGQGGCLKRTSSPNAYQPAKIAPLP
ncbi:hypothetical protein MBT84_45810 [Streptomyces sp. MBT84]|nr:hypothetical protein [Streptomyces sp. MBT84]